MTNLFDITLGRRSNGEPIRLETVDRSTHMQVVGASGRGKSKFLESLIRQDIENPNKPGVLLIDPHGSLYNDIHRFIASNGIEDKRKIHLINPSIDGWAFGFSPLRNDAYTTAAVRVDAMVQACAQVWGGEDSSRTPLLKKCLRAVFFALHDKGYTLLEAVDLVSATDPDSIRTLLTENLSDHVFQSIWDDFNQLAARSNRTFVEQFSSTNNRLLEFLSSPTVRHVVGQQEGINFRECMEQGDIVLVNLAPSNHISLDNARLLGTLMLNDVLITALGRDADSAQERPFYVYLDECYQYLTEDIEKMLDQTRKFGVHLILAHQRLGQIRMAGEGIYNAVMTGAQTKVVFGGLTSEDAHEMAADIFMGEINLEEGVELTKRAMATGEYEIEILKGGSEGSAHMEGGSSSYGESESTSESHSEFAGSVESESMTMNPDGDELLNAIATAISSGSGSASGSSRGSFSSESSSWSNVNSRTSSWNETLKQVFKEMYAERFSYQEQLYKAAVRLNAQPRARAYVKIPGRPSAYIHVEQINPAVITDEYIEGISRELIEGGDFTKEISVIEGEVLKRHEELVALGRSTRYTEEPEDDDNFLT